MTTGKVDGIAKQIDDFVKSGMQVNVNNLVAELSLIEIRVFMFAENGVGLHYCHKPAPTVPHGDSANSMTYHSLLDHRWTPALIA